ncbi:UbiA prenyltransferase family protein [Tenacibaculum salmonis]|uniref:hypothetical protein n=1 Tax=Tenacibaculum sp. P3-BQ1 TaxID=3232310 RepID=UPI0034DFFC6E
MNLLKKLFNFYINSSFHVALAVYCFVRITELYFNLAYNESLDFFLFYGTITGYNFVKYAGVAKLHHRSLTTHLKIIQLFSLVCFLLMCFYATKLKVNTLLFFVPFGLLTFLYAIPFLSGFQKNLRSISYLKIVIVALVWMGSTVFLPLFDADIIFLNNIYLIALQRFLLVVVLILPFDIRDVQYDAVSLQTIPKEIGIKQTKKLGYILLSVCLLIEFIITPNAYFKNIFLIIFSLILMLLMRSSEKQFKYYSSFIVEAVPIIWWILLLIASFYY